MGVIRTDILNTIDLSCTKNGILTKWFSDDNLYFYKTGEFSHGIYNSTTVINEALCFDIAQALGIDSISYELVKLHTENDECLDKDFLATRSPNFLFYQEANSILVTAFELLTKYNYKLNNKIFNNLLKINNNFTEDLSKMLIFDFIINNEDRHLNNIMFEVTETDSKLFFLYDNERSLFYDFDDDKLDRYLRGGFFNKNIDSCKPFMFHHYSQINLVDSYYDLNLDFNIDLILEKYKEYLTNKRVKAISKLVKERIAYVKQMLSHGDN